MMTDDNGPLWGTAPLARSRGVGRSVYVYRRRGPGNKATATGGRVPIGESGSQDAKGSCAYAVMGPKVGNGAKTGRVTMARYELS